MSNNNILNKIDNFNYINKVNFKNNENKIPDNIYNYFYNFPKPYEELFGEDIITKFYSTKYLFEKLEDFYKMIINLVEINKDKLNKKVSRNNYIFNKSNFIFFGLLTESDENDFNDLFNLSMQSVSSKIMSSINKNKNKNKKDFLSKFEEIDGVFNCLSNKFNPFFLNLFDGNYNSKDKDFFMDCFKEYSSIRQKILSVSKLKTNAGILSLEPFIQNDINSNLNNIVKKNASNNKNENNFANSLFFNSGKNIYKGINTKKINSINKGGAGKGEEGDEEDEEEEEGDEEGEGGEEEGDEEGDEEEGVEKGVVEEGKVLSNKGNASSVSSNKGNTKKSSSPPVIDSINYSLFYKKNLSNASENFSIKIREIFKELHENLIKIAFNQEELKLYEILLISIKIDYLSLKFFYSFIESIKFNMITNTSIRINSYIYENIQLYNQYLPSFLAWRKMYVNSNQLSNNKNNSSTKIDEEGLIFDRTLESFFKDWKKKIGNIKESYTEVDKRKNKIENLSKGVKLINKSLKK
jgi:hypothetical protein